MTLEEATKAAECCIAGKGDMYALCHKCPCSHDGDCIENVMQFFVDHVKEEPKMKPKKIEAHPHALYLCGRCLSTYIVNHLDVAMKYCPNCGMKQDWSEVFPNERSD